MDGLLLLLTKASLKASPVGGSSRSIPH